MSKLRENNLGCEDIDIDIEADNNLESTNENSHLSENNITFDASNCTFPADNIEDTVTISVLIVYTAAAKQYATTYFTSIDNVIDLAMQRSNLAMSNSATNITFSLAYKYETTYTEVNNDQDLYNLQGTNDGKMDEVHDLRKQYKADFVMLIPAVTFTGGVAFRLNTEAGFPTLAFGLSRVQQTSGTYTLVHEMGHILGCGHHWQQNTQAGPGLYTYSSGYRGQNASSQWYSTVMTYEAGTYFADGHYAERIPYFSDPAKLHNGVYIGDATHANNVLGVKKTKHVSSRYSDYFNPALKCLSVSAGTLTPSFNTDVTEYTVNVSSNVSTITVYAATTHPTATITQGTGAHSLPFGTKTITVTVSGAGSTKSYTINVNRAADLSVSPADTTICSGNSVTLTASSVSGEATFKWYSNISGGSPIHAGASFTTPILTSTTTYYVSQTISGTESARISVQVTVTPLPSLPTVTPATASICYGSTTTFGLTGGTTYNWYTVSSGGTAEFSSGNSYSTPNTLSIGTHTYYVSTISSNCESTDRRTITITVNALPNVPTANNVTECYDGNAHTASANVGSNESVIWYDAETGGNTTTAPSRSAVGTTSAYAAAKNNTTNCESSTRTLVSITIINAPNTPTINPTTADICSGTTAAFTLTGGTTFNWYTVSSGGTAEFSSNSNYTTLTNLSAGTHTYYVSSVSTCESVNRTTVTITVSASPNAPTPNNITKSYDGNTYTASVSVGNNENVVWYTQATGGNLTTAPSRSTAGATTAYAIAKNTITNCESPTRTEVTVTINPAVLIIKANDYTINVKDDYPVLTCTYNGFVNGEDSTALTQLPVLSCSAANTNVAGEYVITVSGADADNYQIEYVSGKLAIKGVTGKLSNAFTPHNQDGLNDTFGAGYDLIIFNRFGVALFKEKAINNNGWDGRYKGKLVAPGVYYYYAKDSDGVEYRGSVTVVKK
jgi:gliding motility-associated-like protein